LLAFVDAVVNRELNSATDNPLLFESDEISGGNFHGEPIGLAADYLKIASAEVSAISEGRIYRLTAGYTNAGLPPKLVMKPENVGLQSGLMMLQYSAASLVLENQALASPASVLSLPTSAGQEDHNANATMAASQLTKVVRNLRQILAIEQVSSAQAISIRLQNDPQAELGVGTKVAYEWIRTHFPTREDDHPLSDDILSMSELLTSGANCYRGGGTLILR
jgi:histidine ammonia-lyase